jgi:hypothetical protein
MNKFFTTILLLSITSQIQAQELQVRTPKYFQTVIVKDKHRIRCFRREGPHKGTWGTWVETYPIPHALMTHDKNNGPQLVRDFPHLKIQYGLATNSNNGEKYWQYACTFKVWPAKDTAILNNYDIPQEVKVSGYFNYSDDPIYDWKRFGGTSWGTFNLRRAKEATTEKPTPVIIYNQCTPIPRICRPRCKIQKIFERILSGPEKCLKCRMI